MYEKLYEKACEYSLDVVVGSFQTVKNGVKLSNGVIEMPADRVVGRDEIREILVSPAAKSVTWFAWKCLFRKEMLQENQVLFQTGMLGEDALFCLEAMLCANAVYYINSPFYFYEQTPNSQIRTPHKNDLLEKVSLLYEAKLKAYKENGILDAEKLLADYTMSHTLVMLLSNELQFKRSFRRKIEEYRRIRNSKMICDMFEVIPYPWIKLRIIVLIYLLKYRLYALLSFLTN